jgi:hypothetical protein
VDEIFVNCEVNSLLIKVHQIEAVCHEGYPTCYFRKVEDDGAFTVVRDRWFDPSEVYGSQARPSFEETTRIWYGAYEFLRDHDLAAESSTSRRLRSTDPGLTGRVADELNELAGVLTADHRHRDLASDVLLEGSQCLYWIALVAVSNHVGWERLRPDRALKTSDAALSSASASKMLLAEAGSWSGHQHTTIDIAARCHASMALVAQACASMGLPPGRLVQADLAELRDRSYLDAYFSNL